MSFSLAAVASTGAARAPVPRAAARARRDGAAKLSAWTRKVRRPIARVTSLRPEGSALGARGLRRVASWPKGQFITWPPGVLVVSPAETYRA